MKRFLALVFVVCFVCLFLPCHGHSQSGGPNPPSPPPIPTPPPDTQFDYVKVVVGGAGDVDQIEFGTSGKDKIVMYGGTGNGIQYIQGDTNDDWILQVGGTGDYAQTAIAGDGNDTLYQYGGQGTTTQYAEGGLGLKTIIQVGGQDVSEMEIHGGRGGAYIEQYGGQGTNTMVLDGSTGDDVTMMYGGPANDSMTYTATRGSDTVLINGGSGDDTLTIKKDRQNFTLKDYAGNLLFTTGAGGSAITLSNIEHITVIGDDGVTPIFTLTFPGLSVNEGTIGSPITLDGSDFGAKKGNVLIGGAATKIITWEPSSITCEIKKPLLPGTYPVKVVRKEPKGVAPITMTDAFTVMAPHIVSVDPSSGVSGNERVLSGNYFGSKKGKVYLGTKSCKVLNWSMDTIRFMVPNKMASGSYAIMVTNKVGSDTLPDGFTIP